MANKRIELEHYRYYVDLVKEEPPRKRVRRGAVWSMSVAILLAAMMFVLGVFSNTLAQNPNNVLEKPPAATPSQQTVPGQQTIPGQVPGTQGIPNQQIPSQQIPSQQVPGQQIPGQQVPGQQIPGQQVPGQQVPVNPSPGQTPTPAPGGMAPSANRFSMITRGLGGVFPQASSAPVPIQSPASSAPVITPPTSSTPSSSAPGKPKKKELPQTAKNIGNLSNLAKGAGGRGLQIYLLILLIGVGVLMYFGIRRVGREAAKR